MNRIFMVMMVFLFGLFAGVALGQEKVSVNADRPSFTTSPFTLEPDVWQLEMGYTYRDKVDGYSNDFPQSLLRYGLMDKVELRLGWDGYSFTDDKDFANNLAVGAKWNFLDQQDKLPAMGLVATLSLPTGHGPNDVDPYVLFAWSYKWQDFVFSGDLGVGAPTDIVTGDRFSQGVFSLNVEHPVVLFDRNFGVYAEYFTKFPAFDGEGCSHSIGVGFTHKLMDNFQIDLNGGVGLNDEADDWFVGFGVAYSLKFN